MNGTQPDEQVNALAVINGLTTEVARLTQRAVIAEAHAADLEARLSSIISTDKENA